MNDTILANALSSLTITCSDATAYNAEVAKYRVLKLVLEVAKNIESKNVNIKKAVSGLIVSDYMKIDSVDDSLLLGELICFDTSAEYSQVFLISCYLLVFSGHPVDI